MNTDEFVTCPYEKSHRIHKTRLQYHLVKCKRQHMTVKKIICPLNSSHLVNSSDIQQHLATCSSLPNIVQDDMEENNIAPIVDVDIPRPKEDWDTEPAPVASYNAMEMAASKNVLRCMMGLSKSERKKFKNAERLRIENMSGVATGKSLPSKDIDIPIRSPSIMPKANVTANVETKRDHKHSNTPEKINLAERLLKSSQSSKNTSTVDLLNSSSTKSINDSRCLNDEKNNSSMCDKSKKMIAKEKQKDNITEVNLDWQSNYLRKLGLNNVNLKEDGLLDIASNSREQINDDSFNLSRSMSGTKFARSVDEMKQIDQGDKKSIHNFIKLKDQLNMLSDIENRIANEKTRIAEELKNLKVS